MPFWVSQIELILATHPDADHIGGLAAVIRRYRVATYLSNGVEVKVNHGSGEYDNYFIKKTEKGYKITCEFKGYLDSILISNKPFYKFVYQFNTTTEKSCKVLGSFNGENIVTDTILDFE